MRAVTEKLLHLCTYIGGRHLLPHGFQIYPTGALSRDPLEPFQNPFFHHSRSSASTNQSLYRGFIFSQRRRFNIFILHCEIPESGYVVRAQLSL